jgi:hypothetical protein
VARLEVLGISFSSNAGKIIRISNSKIEKNIPKVCGRMEDKTVLLM